MPIPGGAVRGVSFDYGHVLGALDLDELADRLDGELQRPHGVGAGRAEREKLRAALPAAHRAHDEAIAAGLGHHAGWRALIGTLVAAAGTHPTVAEREQVVDALWAAQPTRNLWRAVPQEARALLAELSAASVPLTITSNSEGRIRELLEEVGIAQRFVAVLDSGVLGFAKPDRRIFEAAANALGLPMGAVVHVGDSEAADIVGARSAGMHAIRFDLFVPGGAGTATVADARATTFTDLRALLFDALAL